ncbi:hypothetical protein Pmani_023671 [Petrolisthes manimaculis]|uniref:Uncharacterized protein n=1 Tax=Petrolisthes manimaculis TaxID=1843537 RepID=A0AAE1U0V1_9EUCA|nr:hypothetical protein Pmani_023671 [Petrolisthes manimaculis]
MTPNHSISKDDGSGSSSGASCILWGSSSVSAYKPPPNRDSASSSDSGVCESPRALDRLLASHCLHASLPRPRRPQLSTPAHTHHSDYLATIPPQRIQPDRTVCRLVGGSMLSHCLTNIVTV